jgi:hypothetical protein
MKRLNLTLALAGELVGSLFSQYLGPQTARGSAMRPLASR